MLIKAAMRGISTLTMCLVAAIMVSCSRPAIRVSTSWNPKAAAAYLDYRAGWWMEWTGSARDHGTFCISCHTALTYSLSRPALRTALSEQSPTVDERRLIDNVIKRVRLWKDVGPYYSDQGYDGKAAESRGTESVLNALILASHDAQTGRLSDDTRVAFDHMWALQQTKGHSRGAWLWLQFDQEPWEANDSPYFGAALAAMAVGTASENYASRPEIENNIHLLREYLNRESATQSTINRVFLLWASTKLPGLLESEQQRAIINEVLGRQRADGGWRLASIAWKWNGWSFQSLVKMWLREDGTPLEGKSDGVATGLITLVLQEAGVPSDNAQLKNARFWLLSNQDTGGFWPASSVNKRKSLSSDTGRFMSDAATAFAVLALTENQRATSTVSSAANR